jgi:hypothetical protein
MSSPPTSALTDQQLVISADQVVSCPSKDLNCVSTEQSTVSKPDAWLKLATGILDQDID